MRAIGRRGIRKMRFINLEGIEIDLGSTGLMTTYVIRNWLYRTECSPFKKRSELT